MCPHERTIFPEYAHLKPTSGKMYSFPEPADNGLEMMNEYEGCNKEPQMCVIVVCKGSCFPV